MSTPRFTLSSRLPGHQIVSSRLPSSPSFKSLFVPNETVHPQGQCKPKINPSVIEEGKKGIIWRALSRASPSGREMALAAMF